MVKRIFAVLGDYYHKKDLAIQSLEKAVEQLKAEVDFEVEITYLSVNNIVSRLKEQPDLVIFLQKTV